MNLAGKTNRLAFAGREGSDSVPATVVDRQPQVPCNREREREREREKERERIYIYIY
jgi:hypothetical protein